MSVLYALEGIRNPVMNAIMQLITHLGSETLFLVIAIAVFWCVNKRLGYYILSVGFVGIVFNQFMKLLFHIPRPWVKDPKFTIVESARADAEGYSFPSGHTQNVVTTFGAFARWTDKKWFRAVCFAVIALVGFSRMYLGVHTPADVVTSLIAGIVIVLAFYPFFKNEDRSLNGLFAIFLIVTVAYILYSLLYPFTEVDPENLAHGRENGFKILGAVLALLIAYNVDERYIKYDPKAVWWVQVIKLVFGFALLLAVKEGLKAPLAAIMPPYPACALRYFCLVLFLGTVWPLTFKPLGKLSGRK